jgi:hypothetical protein
MKKRTATLSAQLDPGHPFEVTPRAASRRAIEQLLEELKQRLLEERVFETDEPGLMQSLRGAAADAVALAWLTPFPLLVYPVLFEEIAERARQYAVLQAKIRHRTSGLVVV